MRRLPELLASRQGLGGLADESARLVQAGGGGDLGGGSIRQFRVKEVLDDYLRCRTWDGTTEGTLDVLVAKPEDLRKSVWHGKTISGLAYNYTGTQARTVTQGSIVESQVMTPIYRVPVTGYSGSIIYACRPEGGTGVTVGAAKLTWQDLNVDGRMWLEVVAA